MRARGSAVSGDSDVTVAAAPGPACSARGASGGTAACPSLCPQTWLHGMACGFSVLLFFAVALIYNASCATCYPPSNPYWTMHTLLGDPVFYLTCLLAPVAALLPRCVRPGHVPGGLATVPPSGVRADAAFALSRLLCKALQGTFSPTPLQRGRQLAKRPPRRLGTPREPQGRPPGVLRMEPLEQSSTGASGPLPRDRACPAAARTRAGGRAAPLSSVFSLPALGPSGWVSSLSLLGGLGSALQLSRSGFRADKRGGDLLRGPLRPDRDACGPRGQAADSF